MGIARILVEKHSQIAMTLLPLSVAGGFAYTANVGTNPLDDLKAAVLGGESRIVNIRLATAPRQ